MDSRVIWNIEHILNNELRIYVMYDKNKRLMSNRFYVTFFDVISVSVGEHLIVMKMCSIKQFKFTCMYRTKVFIYMKTLTYFSILFILYCISNVHIFEKQFTQLFNIRCRSFQSP